mmetsp:Transcript_24007/g.25017  ORF Transcript_24007/g.25017 Transcript_24007/m.25017 type:complete len:439 (+) Transcript_24007:6-1322(+)
MSGSENSSSPTKEQKNTQTPLTNTYRTKGSTQPTISSKESAQTDLSGIVNYKVNNIVINFLAGGASALITKLVLYPLDTIKVRMQTQTKDRRLYKNSLDCLLTIVRTEGIRGLYLGVLNPIVSQILFRGNTFLIYGETKRYFVSKNKREGVKLKHRRSNSHTSVNSNSDYIKTWQLLFAASFSTGVCTVLECPLDYFKIQMQVMNVKAQTEPKNGTTNGNSNSNSNSSSDFSSKSKAKGLSNEGGDMHNSTGNTSSSDLNTNKIPSEQKHIQGHDHVHSQNKGSVNSPLFKNSFDCGKQIYRTNGFFGIYYGFRIHFLKNLCGGFYSIGLYELVRKAYSESKEIAIRDLPLHVNFIANAVCWLGHFLSFPVDVIKSNYQSDEVIKEHRRYRSITHTVKSLYKEGGFLRFYQGVFPSLMKTIPSQSIMNMTRFWISEHL